jgi:hypothetical protein
VGVYGSGVGGACRCGVCGEGVSLERRGGGSASLAQVLHKTCKHETIEYMRS